jgi:hypothetical protein
LRAAEMQDTIVPSRARMSTSASLDDDPRRRASTSAHSPPVVISRASSLRYGIAKAPRSRFANRTKAVIA